MIKIIGKYNSATVFLEEYQLDDVTRSQIYDMCNNPAYQGNDTIKIMPDTHLGKNSVIGFTMKFDDRVDPRCVGVDISCGILTVKLDAKVDDLDIPKLDETIQKIIPMGTKVHDTVSQKTKDKFLHSSGVSEPYIKNLCKRIGMDESRFWASLGTLGARQSFH